MKFLKPVACVDGLLQKYVNATNCFNRSVCYGILQDCWDLLGRSSHRVLLGVLRQVKGLLQRARQETFRCRREGESLLQLRNKVLFFLNLQYVSSQLVGKRTALIIWLWGRQMATWSHDHNFLSLWRLLKFLLPDHLTPIGQLIEIKITYKIHFDHLSKRESRDLNGLKNDL
jgi:hypothetical protein